MVKHSARSVLGQMGVVLALASMAAVLAGPARAEGLDPDPAPRQVQAPAPDPSPLARREQSPSTAKPSPTVITRAPAVQPVPPPPVAPQPVPAPPPAPVQRARTEPPKRPAASKPQRARATSRKQRVKQKAVRAIRSVAATTKSSPDGMLLAGGLALFALLLCEAIFLALSVRFLRRTA
jgi:hypothetical protein